MKLFSQNSFRFRKESSGIIRIHSKSEEETKKDCLKRLGNKRQSICFVLFSKFLKKSSVKKFFFQIRGQYYVYHKF